MTLSKVFSATLLVHPGAPFWRNKGDGAWSIPKGEIEASENPKEAARRELPRSWDESLHEVGAGDDFFVEKFARTWQKGATGVLHRDAPPSKAGGSRNA
jgi:predicted NUDIX family NTP pyrophosphohydrolase